jgi:hypothetical protein
MTDQIVRLYPGAVYDQSMITAMHNDMVDSLMFSALQRLPARKLFASYWRVLHIDGFAEARNRTIQFYWPTKLVRIEDLTMYYAPESSCKAFIAQDTLSPYRDRDCVCDRGYDPQCPVHPA